MPTGSCLLDRLPGLCNRARLPPTLHPASSCLHTYVGSSFARYLTVWALEADLPHQTSWLDNTGEGDTDTVLKDQSSCTKNA